MALNTYRDLQTSVLNWLARPNDPLVQPALPDMVRLFEAEATRRLEVGAAEKHAVITTAAGVPSVDLPADFGQLRQASIDGRALTYVTPSSLPGLTGLPIAHTIWGQSKLWLGPAPDNAYDIELLYQSGVPPLSDSNPTNWLILQAPDAYLFGVLVEAELYIGHDERLQTWAQRREAAFLSVEQADRKARWGGPLTIQVDGITMPAGGGSGAGGSAMSAVYIGDMPPPNPLPGNEWWDSVSGQLFVFYVDPSGPPGAWIAATNQPVAGPGTGPGSIETVYPEDGAIVVTTFGGAWVLTASGAVVTATGSMTRSVAPGGIVEVEAATPSVYVASAPLNALTVRMLPEPQTGDTVQLCCNGPIAALTVQDAEGNPVLGAPGSAYGPGAAIVFRYSTPPGAWIYWK